MLDKSNMRRTIELDSQKSSLFFRQTAKVVALPNLFDELKQILFLLTYVRNAKSAGMSVSPAKRPKVKMGGGLFFVNRHDDEFIGPETLHDDSHRKNVLEKCSKLAGKKVFDGKGKCLGVACFSTPQSLEVRKNFLGSLRKKGTLNMNLIDEKPGGWIHVRASHDEYWQVPGESSDPFASH